MAVLYVFRIGFFLVQPERLTAPEVTGVEEEQHFCRGRRSLRSFCRTHSLQGAVHCLFSVRRRRKHMESGKIAINHFAVARNGDDGKVLNPLGS